LDQMKLMLSAGMEFGAHTMNHKKLNELSAEEAFYEISESRKQMEAQLGQEVISFAYPYGYYSDELEQMVSEAGLKYAVIINGGGLHLEENPLAIFRVYIFPEDDDTQLRKKTASWYRRYIRWKRGR
jgi:peptidoglycan/xylan/chitin deacetylase (PgdA/CDA1 family)